MDTQTNTQISLKAIEKSQYPWNKHIPFVVNVNVFESGINYMQIVPQATSGYFQPNIKALSNINKGVHTYKFIYIPLEQGQVNYTFSVVASTNKTNFASSDSGSMVFNNRLIRIPMTSGYMLYQIGMYLFFLLLVLSILFGVKKGLYYLKDTIIPKLIRQQVDQGV